MQDWRKLLSQIWATTTLKIPLVITEGFCILFRGWPSAKGLVKIKGVSLMKNKLFVVVATLTMSSTAIAQSAFEGFYTQVGIGYTDTLPTADNVSLTVNNGPYKGTYARSSTYENTGEFTGQITAGYMFALSDKFLLGLGVDYAPVVGSPNNVVTVGSAGIKSYSTYKVTSHLNVFLSPAYAVDKDKLIYGKVGYSQSQSNVSFANNESPDHTAQGYVLGLGYKQIISGGWYGFAEANYFMYNSKSYNSSGVDNGASYSSSQSLKSSGYEVLVGVGYRF